MGSDQRAEAAEAAEVDVMVIGAGPAGSVAALTLARHCRVLLVERQTLEPDGGSGVTRIGESLAPAARRILTDLGLWPAFQAQGHARCHANRSLWGSAEPVDSDLLRDADGPGWHLDRTRFDCWLRDAAGERGAALLCPAEPVAIEASTQANTQASTQGGWLVTVQGTAGQQARIRTAVLIDASGRTASVARQLGARRQAEGRLICAWLHGTDSHPATEAGLTRIQSVPDGWWYSAPLPGARRVLAFHTDADLADSVHSRNGLLTRAGTVPELADLLRRSGFQADAQAGFTAAHSARLEPFCGPGPGARSGWLAAGDAALSFDPLSSQGLFNALYTGLAAGEAADRILNGSGTAEALADHTSRLESIHKAYRDHLSIYYGTEQRWPDQPFWQRRHQGLPPPTPPFP
jgi:flavin-dependent dehydrogenase